eukprot:13241303-Alexandrium_andersonii.AAC.1
MGGRLLGVRRAAIPRAALAQSTSWCLHLEQFGTPRMRRRPCLLGQPRHPQRFCRPSKGQSKQRRCKRNRQLRRPIARA